MHLGLICFKYKLQSIILYGTASTIGERVGPSNFNYLKTLTLFSACWVIWLLS